MSKILKEDLPKAALILLIFSIICGLLYTLAVTGISQLLFSDKANGSIVEVNGKKYGSELLAQQFNDEKHMWGRIMNVDTKTFTDKDGSPVMYASPSNLTPAGETKQKDKGELKEDEKQMKELVADRVAMIRKANPEQTDKKVPVDLVTCSGSGLDPGISVAAAEYQIPRLVKTTGKSAAELRKIVDKYTVHKFLGIFGEEYVNVLKVNLALEGILK